MPQLMLRKMVDFLFYTPFNKKISAGKGVISQDQLRGFEGSVVYDKPEILSVLGGNYSIIGTNKTPSWKKDFSQERLYKGSSYTVLTNVSLVGKHGIVVYKKKVVLDSILSSIGYLIRNSQKKLLIISWLIPFKKKYELGFSLANCLSNSYFHWVAETLPMLEALKAYENKYGRNSEIKIFVNEGFPSFASQYLKLLGIKEQQVEILSDRAVKVKTFIQASTRYYSLKNPHDYWSRHIYPKSAFDFLRVHLLQSHSVKKNLNKIYISREDADQRGLNNEDELYEVLSKYGYQKIILSNYSVKEQICIFQNLTHLVAPHGAGLVNTVFSSAIQIVELYPADRAFGYNYHYYQISNHYKHTHKLLLCVCDAHQNMTVDLNLLQTLL